LLKPETLPRLMQAGYREPPRIREMQEAINLDNTELALGLVSPSRLGALRDILEVEMHDDLRGLGRVEARFEEVQARV